MKTPKKYECTECNTISDKFKKVKFPMMTFAVCFKCEGRLQERQEWLDWLDEERSKLSLHKTGD